MLQAIRAHRSVFNDQYIFHIRMSLNREAKCRKAESQQVKLENEEMGAWQEVPLLDTGSSRSYTADPATGSPTLCPGPPVGRLIAHKDAKGRTFYTVEGQDPICMVGVRQ